MKLSLSCYLAATRTLSVPKSIYSDPGVRFGTSVGIRVGPNRHLRLLTSGIDANHLHKRATHSFPIFLATFRGWSGRCSRECWCNVFVRREQGLSPALPRFLRPSGASIQGHIQFRGVFIVPLIQDSERDLERVAIFVRAGRTQSNT